MLNESQLEAQYSHMCEWITRWYHLRKLGLCVPLLQDGLHLYTFDLANPWGSKVSITLEQLHQMVLEGEASLRKGPGHETDITQKEQTA